MRGGTNKASQAFASVRRPVPMDDRVRHAAHSHRVAHVPPTRSRRVHRSEAVTAGSASRFRPAFLKHRKQCCSVCPPLLLLLRFSSRPASSASLPRTPPTQPSPRLRARITPRPPTWPPISPASLPVSRLFRHPWLLRPYLIPRSDLGFHYAPSSPTPAKPAATTPCPQAKRFPASRACILSSARAYRRAARMLTTPPTASSDRIQGPRKKAPPPILP